METRFLIVWFIISGILIAVGVFSGVAIGRASTQKSGGEIIFREYSDGSESCVFNLKGDIDWMKDQKIISFRVRKETIDKPKYDDDAVYSAEPSSYPQA